MVKKLKNVKNIELFFGITFFIIVVFETIVYLLEGDNIEIYLFIIWYFFIYLLLISIISALKKRDPRVNKMKHTFSIYCLLVMEYIVLGLLFFIPSSQYVSQNSLLSPNTSMLVGVLLLIFLIIKTKLLLWGAPTNVKTVQRVPKKKRVSKRKEKWLPKVVTYIESTDKHDMELTHYRIGIGLESFGGNEVIIKVEPTRKNKDGTFEILEEREIKYYETKSGLCDFDKINFARREVKRRYEKIEAAGIIDRVDTVIV